MTPIKSLKVQREAPQQEALIGDKSIPFEKYLFHGCELGLLGRSPCNAG
jgi:hypothetical protein